MGWSKPANSPESLYPLHWPLPSSYELSSETWTCSQKRVCLRHRTTCTRMNRELVTYVNCSTLDGVWAVKSDHAGPLWPCDWQPTTLDTKVQALVQDRELCHMSLLEEPSRTLWFTRGNPGRKPAPSFLWNFHRNSHHVSMLLIFLYPFSQ